MVEHVTHNILIEINNKKCTNICTNTKLVHSYLTTSGYSTGTKFGSILGIFGSHFWGVGLTLKVEYGSFQG
jgi:hypothetical protein